MTLVNIDNTHSLIGRLEAVQIKSFDEKAPRYFCLPANEYDDDEMSKEVSLWMLRNAPSSALVGSLGVAITEIEWIVECIGFEKSLSAFLPTLENEDLTVKCGVRIAIDFVINGTHVRVTSSNYNSPTIDDI
jgi:hypothetical protein